MNFQFLRIAAFRNSVFASLRLYYVMYWNMLCNVTDKVFVLQYFILPFFYIEFRLDAGLILLNIFSITEFV
jgi:hypothetical protein